MVIFASSLPYSLSESNTPVMSHSIAPLQIFGGRQEAVTVFVSVFNQQKACQYQYFGPTQKILLLFHLRWGVVGGANAIRKRDRTALIWNQAILTRDNTNHYDDDKNRVVWFLEENRNQYEERWKSTPCKERRSDRVVKVCPTWWPTMGHCLEECVCKKLAWQPRDRSSQHPNQITICFKSDQADKKSKLGEHYSSSLCHICWSLHSSQHRVYASSMESSSP